MPSPRSQRIIKHIWQCLALGLLLFALLVSLIRGLLPQVPQVRQQLVEYLQHTYKLDVQVASIEAQWQAFGPELTISGLVIPPQDALPITLVMDKVTLKLDFWDSLASLSPQIETVSFDGVQLALDLSHVASSPKDDSALVDANTDWIYELALEQLSHFSVTNASLQLFSDVKQFEPIYINDLVWLNTQGRHRGEGQLLMDSEGQGTQSVSLRVDLKGDGYEPDSLSGQAYLLANEIDVGQWLNRRQLIQTQITDESMALESKLSFEAWFDLGKRTLTSGLLVFKPSGLKWQLDGQAQSFSLNSGALSLDNSDAGWQLQSRELTASTNGQVWSNLAIGVNYQDGQFSAQLDPIELALVTPLLALAPHFNPDAARQWLALAPQGKIGPVSAHYNQQQGWQAQAYLSQLQWQAALAIPGLNAIDARVSYDRGVVDVDLPAQAYQLDFAGGFEAPLNVSGEAIHGQFDLADLKLTLPNLALANQDINLAASLSLSLKDEAYLTLAANVQVAKAQHLGAYFPLGAMSAGLVSYLNGAIIEGQVPDGQIVWHGALADYPYGDSSGVFQAGFHLEEASYEFEPHWPAIEDLRLYALFENAAMDIWVDRGQLQQVAIDGAHVYIPELGDESLLRVEAEIVTQASAATKVLQNSPLRDSVGKVLTQVQVQGEVRSQLDLSIPLFEGQEERIAGGVHFTDNQVFIVTPGLELTKLNGDISFINNALLGKSLKAELFNQAVGFSFATQEQDNNLALDLDMQGKVVLSALPQQLQQPISAYYQGHVDWEGAMTMVFEPEGHSLQLQLASDLVGTSLSLPAPFNKAADERFALNVELAGDNNTSHLRVTLGDKAELVGDFTEESGGRLAYYDIMLGRHFRPEDQLNQHQGHVQLAMAKVQLAPWLPVLDTIGTMAATSDDSFFPGLKSVYGRVQEFDLHGLELNELSFSAISLTDRWRFVAEAIEFDGRIDLFPDWREQGLTMDAKRFYLSTAALKLKQPSDAEIDAEVKAEPESLVTRLPKLDIKVEDFHLDGLMLGELTLGGKHSEQGYQFNQLSLIKEGVSLNAQGTWSKVDGRDHSDFSLDLQADKFDLLSQALQIEPGVKDAPLKVSGKLAWQAAPYEFTLDKLDGKLSFELGKGHLSEISDKGARIFSLFSLDSLLRKLSFDFSDVFGNGLYFDEFKGNIAIDKGVLKTKDTEMDAIAGNMKVRGYTDLSRQSLNYDIRFVPQLASSVPTVVLLSTSAWTLGLGAFALTKVLEPVIEVISEIRFRVTGTMTDPNIQELGRKIKEIEIPEAILPPKALLPTQVMPPEQPKVEPVRGNAAKNDVNARPKT